MNTNSWRENVRNEDNIIVVVNGSTDSVGEHISVEPSDDYTPATAPINLPISSNSEGLPPLPARPAKPDFVGAFLIMFLGIAMSGVCGAMYLGCIDLPDQ
jgi:hypothetical protein